MHLYINEQENILKDTWDLVSCDCLYYNNINLKLVSRSIFYWSCACCWNTYTYVDKNVLFLWFWVYTLYYMKIYNPIWKNIT